MACLITDAKSIPLWPTWQYTKHIQGPIPKRRGRNSDDNKGFIRRAAYRAMGQFWAESGLTPDHDFSQLPTPEHTFKVINDVFPQVKTLQAIRKWK